MAEDNPRKFELRKVYLKDMSFESPMAPEIFTNASAAPGIEVQLNISHQTLPDDLYEAVLTVTVRGKLDQRDAFLVEVQQAGLYEISGIDLDRELGVALGVSCPTMLFPFAREAISNLVVRGGFPQLLLAPVNFESLYRHKLRNDEQNAARERPSGNGAQQPEAEPSSQ